LPAAAGDAPRPADDPNLVLIRSPMVGTFYGRANPKAEPFVRVGDQVDNETTVCIIEAMKVFNEIPAEISGRIVAVLVNDEEAVDFGRPLFKIDTSK
jgi:acetyl-CoA carboxylase biotin carboxyl carrier protein